MTARSGRVMQAAVDFRYDVVNGVIKSAVFGTVVSLIAVFEGDCQPTAEGVSRAITRTVVTSRAGHTGAGFRAYLPSCSGLMNPDRARPMGRFRGNRLCGAGVPSP